MEWRSADWSKHDENCSKSFTHAGVAVLLLSAIGVSMLPSLGKMRSLNDLLGYISRRITLHEEFARIGSDPVWKRLLAKEPAARDWELGKIASYREQGDLKSVVSPATKKQPTEKSSETAKLGAPESKGTPPPKSSVGSPQAPLASPTGLRVTIEREVAPAPLIIKTLEELADFEYLSRARQYSYRYDTAIYRWSLLLSRMLEEMPREPPPSSSAKAVRQTPILRLTPHQIEELSNFDLPDVSEAERLLREASFTLPSVGMPLGLTSATMFIEVTILVLTVYLWIWHREARLSPNFPAPGTLFGAFSRSSLSRLVFSLLILLPPVTAALMAARTYWISYWNSIFAVLTILGAVLFNREGQLKPEHNNVP